MSRGGRGVAAENLRALYPTVGPWTEAALWFGLGALTEPPVTPLADEIEVLAGQRLAGLAIAYIAESGASVPAADLGELRRSEFFWTVLSRTAIERAPEQLLEQEAGRPRSAVSKGPGIARHYPRFELRPFSDIDVLVHEADFTSVVDRLAALDWSEESRNKQPWNFFRRYCREGLNLARHDGGRIDVHHRIPPWLWSERMRVPEMLERSIAVSVGGRDFHCLSDADNLLVASLHVVSDRNSPGQSLIVWRDIVQLARAAEVDDVLARAREAGLTRWLAAVLGALPQPFGTESLRAALEREGGELPHARRLAALLSPWPARWGVLATQVLRLPIVNGLMFAVGMLVPSPAFLRDRYPGARGRYRRWWRDARTSRAFDSP